MITKTVENLLDEMVNEFVRTKSNNDFEKLKQNYAEKIVKLFAIPDVIKCDGNERRELLIDFVRYMNTNTIMAQYEWINAPAYVDMYLKSINCL